MGSQPRPKCNKGHAMEGENLVLKWNGTEVIGRQCRTCTYERNARSRAKKKERLNVVP